MFDLLDRIRGQAPADGEAVGTKEAFTPSPAMEQQVLSGGGGGGGMPSGMDPAMMAQMGGGGASPPGAMPGGPEGGGGMPPGTDPAAAGGAPPTDSPDPLHAKLDTLINLMQQQQQGQGGGPGQPGKPNTASIKFEPAHFQQMTHDVSAMKAVMGRIAEAMGIEVPASAMLNMPSPGQALPGAPGQASPPGGGPNAQAAAAPPQAPPSQIAQALPPVAAKAAGAQLDPHTDALRLSEMLKAGSSVPATVSGRPTRGASLAAFSSIFARHRGEADS